MYRYNNLQIITEIEQSGLLNIKVRNTDLKFTDSEYLMAEIACNIDTGW